MADIDSVSELAYCEKNPSKTMPALQSCSFEEITLLLQFWKPVFLPRVLLLVHPQTAQVFAPVVFARWASVPGFLEC